MSNEVYPELPGLTWPVEKTPEFSTLISRAADLSEVRATYVSQPVYEARLSYDFLRQTTGYSEYDTLGGFFKSMYGSWDSFLFDDITDNTATAEVFGLGDGTTANFQLSRSAGGFDENVCTLHGTPTILAGNAPAGNHTISSTGVVMFVSPPSNGSVLSWTGEFYYRCRFSKDMQQFSEFMRNLWDARGVDIRMTLGSQLGP